MTSSNHETGCPALGRRIADARNAKRRRAGSTWQGYGQAGKWSQAWVAEQIGISRSSLAQIERGARAPSVAAWHRLAELLELDATTVQHFVPPHHLTIHVRARRADRQAAAGDR